MAFRRYRTRGYSRRRYRPFYRAPRRSLGYGSLRTRRRFYKCRLNGGTWNRCKKRAFWKPYTWIKEDDINGPVYRKVPRPGWTPQTLTFTKTKWVKNSPAATSGM